MTAYRPPPNNGLTILYEDEDLLAVNKPSGLLSVQGRGTHKQDCLATRVQARYPEALIVHRLDMETSGVMLMARHAQGQRQLSRLFQQRQVHKRYVAVVEGGLSALSGEIDLPLICDWPRRPRQKVDFSQGKPAQTRYRVLRHDPEPDTSRLQLEPITGRSHQLRVHLQALGHPIVGDRLYASAETVAKSERLLLHAQSIAFAHPATGKPLEVVCPADF